MMQRLVLGRGIRGSMQSYGARPRAVRTRTPAHREELPALLPPWLFAPTRNSTSEGADRAWALGPTEGKHKKRVRICPPSTNLPTCNSATISNSCIGRIRQGTAAPWNRSSTLHHEQFRASSSSSFLHSRSSGDSGPQEQNEKGKDPITSTGSSGNKMTAATGTESDGPQSLVDFVRKPISAAMVTRGSTAKSRRSRNSALHSASFTDTTTTTTSGPTRVIASENAITDSTLFKQEVEALKEGTQRQQSRIGGLELTGELASKDSAAAAAAAYQLAGTTTALHSSMFVSGAINIQRRYSKHVEWIDVVATPTASLDDYRGATAIFLTDLGLHDTLVENTMESVLLPQTMILGDSASIILRSAVSSTTADMDSIQELTNRLTVVVLDNQVLTIHRPEMDFLSNLHKDWDQKHRTTSKIHLVNLVVKRCVKTYQEALAKSILLFDEYESKLFGPQKQRSQLARQIYHIKRRASVYSRILALQIESYAQVAGALGVPKYDIYFQDVAQHIAHVRSLSEELNDNANAVLQLLFQLSSYQLNELMRVLTMFSAFFIPLTFITGAYGMNFENLPGAQSEEGPLYCFLVMGMISISLLAWFRAKGFW